MESIEKVVTEVGIEGGVVAKMVAIAEGGRITTPMELDVAAQYLAGVKGYLKGIEAKYKGWTEGLNQSLKRIRDDYNPVKAAAEKAERIWKGKINAFHHEQEQRRQLQEAKLREQAEKDQAKMEAQAQRLLDKGKTEQAEVKLAEAEAIPTPVVAPPEKIKGISYRDTWEFEVVDEAKVPRMYLLLDHKKIGAQVRATKDTLEIPGIRVFKTTTVASGSRE